VLGGEGEGVARVPGGAVLALRAGPNRVETLAGRTTRERATHVPHTRLCLKSTTGRASTSDGRDGRQRRRRWQRRDESWSPRGASRSSRRRRWRREVLD